MSRTHEKIRDLVEPQAYETLQNFSAEPARALATYRFTAATSDLLARWLDVLADLPRGRGAALALAGLRGVGKSHALAAFGAMIAFSELRSSIADAHVGVSARRLANRRHVVARVERGVKELLEEEMAAALRAAFPGEPAFSAEMTLTEMLAGAAQYARGATLVVLVDTAYGRESRVSRDDGPLLSELGEAAREVGAFVGLALDDDIAGADGINAALAQSFQIDYLEPEHLYQVVDNHLFRKHAAGRAALHELYLSLRGTVPGFNWSEPRFATLYPLHPLVADVSASVRLHAPTFAFLTFAAAAAGQAVNRPAVSLILLDEVFDRTEKELRAAAELQDAFRVYDELATKAVAQFPALQRLQVRLILKSLFVLSLDGRGATARDLCAALLFEGDAPAADAAPGGKWTLGRVEEALLRLEKFAPSEGLRRDVDGQETRYRFQVGAGGDSFNAALAGAEESVDDAQVNGLLRALARERFGDWPLGAEQDAGQAAAADFAVSWRGTPRPGCIVRRPNGQSPPADTDPGRYDWELIILEPGADGQSAWPSFAPGRG
ncbi:MAG: hypothetical protein ACRD9R_21925, partial [Pyrinomonadaceae bacterium]